MTKDLIEIFDLICSLHMLDDKPNAHRLKAALETNIQTWNFHLKTQF